MSELKKFVVQGTGEVVSYPPHFADHPVFGLNLEPYDEEEVDKVVTAGHELPVEQRVSFVAKPTEADKTEENDKKRENK